MKLKEIYEELLRLALVCEDNDTREMLIKIGENIKNRLAELSHQMDWK